MGCAPSPAGSGQPAGEIFSQKDLRVRVTPDADLPDLLPEEPTQTHPT